MYITVWENCAGVGDTPDKAFDDLIENNSGRDPEIEEVVFYKAEEIKVKRTILIVENEKDKV